MRKHYDFSKSVRNLHLSKAKKQLTIRLDEGTIKYFKALAEQNGIPYQNLINFYLRECAEWEKKLTMKRGWPPARDFKTYANPARSEQLPTLRSETTRPGLPTPDAARASKLAPTIGGAATAT